MTTREFCAREGITATVHRRENNPNMDDMPAGSNHFTVTLRRRLEHGTPMAMAVPFSQGPAVKEWPTAHDVLDCLASDASSADQPFEVWARDYGFDPDSRKAERTYKAVVEQTAKLRAFLGNELLDELLYQTERM